MSKQPTRDRNQKREKRLAKGKEVKAKDMINKGHEQFVLTWGMMLGVQMSVGRQFEFSAKTSAKNVVETNKNKTEVVFLCPHGRDNTISKDRSIQNKTLHAI